jgi:dTDP-4-dehydrorhamnose 3,5-epimerase
MTISVRDLEIPGVLLIERRALSDHRGIFMETYKRSEFEAAGIPASFVQDNYSSSTHGVLRGLHYQRSPKAQAKLITVLQGAIFDVVVDLRPDSPMYRRWTSVVLSSANRRMLYVPVGLAHGFCVVSQVADVVYKTTTEYAPEFEAGIRFNDPYLKITWPIVSPVLSEKDANLPLLEESRYELADTGIS